MKQIVTTAIILSRTEYGEADRILTLLTPDYGKLRLMAKGVRRIKSKLAGGIELFSVSTITFVKGRGDMGTLISARLHKHYGQIVHDLDRTMAGYELIKQLNKITEDAAEPEYFELLQRAFEALDGGIVTVALIRFWFSAQLIRLGGHAPNLRTDDSGNKFDVEMHYNFNFDTMSFVAAPDTGRFNAHHIKLLRLVFAGTQPLVLQQVQGLAKLLDDITPLLQTMATQGGY